MGYSPSYNSPIFPPLCYNIYSFSSVQFSSVQSCPTLCHPMDCSMPGLPVHHQLPEFTQTHIHHVDDAVNHLILCRPLLLLLSIFPSIRVFICHFFASGWSFSFSTSLSSEYSGLTSFRMDWLDLQGRLVAVQETLNSHLQHHSSKASMLVLSFLYNPTLKPTHDY